MNMTVRTAVTLMVIIVSFVEAMQEPAQPVPSLKLILDDEHTYTVPLAGARQSGTIAHMIEDMGPTQEFYVPSTLSPEGVRLIAQAMHVDTTTLQGKALLNALETKIGTQNLSAHLFEFLPVINYLDYQPGIALAARYIITHPREKKDGIFVWDKVMELLRNNRLSYDFALTLSRFNYLFTLTDLRYYCSAPNDKGIQEDKQMIEIKARNFSIRDYIDYRPALLIHLEEKITRNKLLDLSGLRLTSLEGLNEIPHIKNIQEIDVSSNELSELPANAFNACPAVKYVWLNNNYLSLLPGNIFRPLKNLEELDLSKNKFKKFPVSLLSDNTALIRLYLRGNELTHENRKDLKQAFPTVHIHFKKDRNRGIPRV